MWQRPKQGKLHWTDNLWYNRVRVGRDPIERMLSFLSVDINLSKRYTNHSIRATVMGILGEKYEGRIVIGWSGHKSEQTIKQYIRKLPAKTKKEISGTLHDVIQLKVQKKDDKPTATVSKRPEENSPSSAANHQNEDPVVPKEPQQNDMQFQLEDIDDAPPDDVLIQFLNQFDPVTENPPPQPIPPQPLQPSNTMNVNNVSNVQNILGNQKMLPTMFFGGNSNVTINYNFGPPQ